MKKRTLNQTWVLCLRMWRAAAKELVGKIINDYDTIDRFKRRWMEENGFGSEKIKSNCFFCDYVGKDENGDPDCTTCPGALVDPYFDCCDDEYYFRYYPQKFYEELLRLNRIRKGKNEN